MSAQQVNLSFKNRAPSALDAAGVFDSRDGSPGGGKRGGDVSGAAKRHNSYGGLSPKQREALEEALHKQTEDYLGPKSLTRSRTLYASGTRRGKADLGYNEGETTSSGVPHHSVGAFSRSLRSGGSQRGGERRRLHGRTVTAFTRAANLGDHKSGKRISHKKLRLLRTKLRAKGFVGRDKDTAIRKLLARYDRNHDKVLSYAEFVKLARSLVPLTDDELEQLIAYFDSNRDGIIDVEEFARFIDPKGVRLLFRKDAGGAVEAGSSRAAGAEARKREHARRGYGNAFRRPRHIPGETRSPRSRRDRRTVYSELPGRGGMAGRPLTPQAKDALAQPVDGAVVIDQSRTHSPRLGAESRRSMMKFSSPKSRRAHVNAVGTVAWRDLGTALSRAHRRFDHLVGESRFRDGRLGPAPLRLLLDFVVEEYKPVGHNIPEKTRNALRAGLAKQIARPGRDQTLYWSEFRDWFRDEAGRMRRQHERAERSRAYARRIERQVGDSDRIKYGYDITAAEREAGVVFDDDVPVAARLAGEVAGSPQSRAGQDGAILAALGRSVDLGGSGRPASGMPASGIPASARPAADAAARADPSPSPIELPPSSSVLRGSGPRGSRAGPAAPDSPSERAAFFERLSERLAARVRALGGSAEASSGEAPPAERAGKAGSRAAQVAGRYGDLALLLCEIKRTAAVNAVAAASGPERELRQKLNDEWHAQAEALLQTLAADHLVSAANNERATPSVAPPFRSASSLIGASQTVPETTGVARADAMVAQSAIGLPVVTSSRGAESAAPPEGLAGARAVARPLAAFPIRTVYEVFSSAATSTEADGSDYAGDDRFGFQGAGGDRVIDRTAFCRAFEGLCAPSGVVPEARERVRALAGVLYGAFDFDGDGQVTVREVSTGVSVLCGGGPNQKVEETFRLYDTDASGLISMEEMTDYLTSVFRVVYALEPGRHDEQGTPEDLGRQSAMDAFRLYDVDLDGCLTQEEFGLWARGGSREEIQTMREKSQKSGRRSRGEWTESRPNLPSPKGRGAPPSAREARGAKGRRVRGARGLPPRRGGAGRRTSPLMPRRR
jgi:Ca2+-binding EF-hand superfamily protein